VKKFTLSLIFTSASLAFCSSVFAVAVPADKIDSKKIESTGEKSAGLIFPNAKTKVVDGGLVDVNVKVSITTDGKTLIIGGRAISVDAILVGDNKQAKNISKSFLPSNPIIKPTVEPVVKADSKVTQSVVDKPTLRIDFSTLPVDKSIVFTKGDGSRKFAVFTDLDCPYCKMFETSLKSLSNYTMYVFMMPVKRLHPYSVERSEKIWCAGNNEARAKAWTNYMDKSTVLDVSPCSTPIDDIAAFANKNNIKGTPYFIRSDGAITIGAMPTADFEKWLNN